MAVRRQKKSLEGEQPTKLRSLSRTTINYKKIIPYGTRKVKKNKGFRDFL